jgi:hypothetical protein
MEKTGAKSTWLGTGRKVKPEFMVSTAMWYISGWSSIYSGDASNDGLDNSVDTRLDKPAAGAG